MNRDGGEWREVKKLRKKLRHIDKLERLGHPLNDEEKLMIVSKQKFRDELQKNVLALKPKVKGQDTIPTADLLNGTFNGHEKVEQDFERAENTEAVPDTDNAVPSSCEQQSADGTETETEVQRCESLKRQHDDRVEVKSSSQGSSPSTSKSLKRMKSDKKRRASDAGQEKCRASGDSHNQNLENLWRSAEFTVETLKGHSDSVAAVAADGNLIVSASYDTTVRVWNGETGQETCSLRGHTGGVTCLTLLDEDAGHELCRYLGLTEQHRIALTGSTDCSVIMWSLNFGRSLKSIYTFNTVTCLVFVASEVCIVTATDGGKIEIWDAVSGSNLRSLTMFDESYTCMVVEGNNLFAASSDGIIKIWEICNRDLISRFTLEQLDSADGLDLILRRVHCLEACQDWVFYGDDGVNLKAFNWKTGDVRKYINHTCESGATDGVVCTGQEIISTAYDLDSASGRVNGLILVGDLNLYEAVRRFPDGGYLCTLSDNRTGRIHDVASTTTSHGVLRLVTGGTELKIWNICQFPRSKKRQNVRSEIFKAMHIPYYTKQATNSDYESSESEGEESSGSDQRYERTYVPREVTGRSSWWPCSIL